MTFAAEVVIDSTVAGAAVGLLGAVVVALLTWLLGRWSEATARRRDGYAAASRELVAWAEYPYRIRRRTSDDPATLDELVGLGNALQEALRYRQTWISSENARTGRAFRSVRDELKAGVGAACRDAWQQPPVTGAAGMNLNGWGPGADVDDALDRFENAVANRFGWRRLYTAIRPWGK